ncbi:hypothetical protein SISNIDRAFT_340040 [Sistotremastrum niveocremeum HHB9708]|uniref:Uncharacterized protein n=1 Tax=Sistotremastrum niveocremeum HHB9708 TaxID=1314777 RepID=A0A164XPM6_9AGAM|nr:hypothetical protein SISNIDRAFT_340040 [Sistotremastrum niveocremeum HHB9708]
MPRAAKTSRRSIRATSADLMTRVIERRRSYKAHLCTQTKHDETSSTTSFPRPSRARNACRKTSLRAKLDNIDSDTEVATCLKSPSLSVSSTLVESPREIDEEKDWKFTSDRLKSSDVCFTPVVLGAPCVRGSPSLYRVGRFLYVETFISPGLTYGTCYHLPYKNSYEMGRQVNDREQFVWPVPLEGYNDCRALEEWTANDPIQLKDYLQILRRSYQKLKRFEFANNVYRGAILGEEMDWAIPIKAEFTMVYHYDDRVSSPRIL